LRCGINCVLDVDTSCKTTCSNSNHYKSINGRCELKGCEERNKNESTRIICGRTDCYLNVNKSDGSDCDSICGYNSKGISGVCTPCEHINASDTSSCRGENLNNCFYKEGEEKCVLECGSGYGINGDICTSICGEIDATNILLCSGINNCYYKEGMNKCIDDCGEGYKADDGRNECMKVESSGDGGESKGTGNVPWWIILIIVGVIVIGVIVVIVVIIKYKNKKTKLDVDKNINSEETDQKIEKFYIIYFIFDDNI
jgi:hypothetical protein